MIFVKSERTKNSPRTVFLNKAVRGLRSLGDHDDAHGTVVGGLAGGFLLVGGDGGGDGLGHALVVEVEQFGELVRAEAAADAAVGHSHMHGDTLLSRRKDALGLSVAERGTDYTPFSRSRRSRSASQPSTMSS